MGIIQSPTKLPGQTGVIGALKYMVTTDSLATITTAGYLNNIEVSVSPISPSDVIGVTYSYNIQTNTGTFEIFTVSISNGVITLTQWANPGDVLLPVVSGDMAVFNGTTGQIKDSGAAPSAASQAYVVMSPGSLTSGNIPFLNDANGTLNTGRTPSATTAGYKVVMSPGSITSGNLLKAGDTNGTVADQGFQIKSVAGAAAAGGAAAQSFTDAFCTSASNVIGNWNTQANAASVLKIVPGNGSFVVTSSADAGVGTFNYIITK